MATVFPETTKYRIILIMPKSRRILAYRETNDYRLPRIRIREGTRPAQELGRAIRAKWGLAVLILEFVFTRDVSSSCVIAELLKPTTHPDFTEVTPSQLRPYELMEEESSTLLSILSGECKSLFSRIGWLDEVSCWVERATGRRLSSKADVEQVNAGGATTLLRFRIEDGRDYWLKATTEPNAHELAVTALLSRISREYLPEFIDSRPEWNAWLVSGQAVAITELPSESERLFNLLDDAVESMAELQMRTVGREQELLESGAFDQRLDTLVAHSDDMFAFVEEAMGSQTSTKARRIEESRLREIREIFERICHRLHRLDLPNTVLHGDMNPANILTGSRHCQFIDWCEAYVGNPLITFEHILLLNQRTPPDRRESNAHSLKNRYRAKLSNICNPQSIDDCFLYSPILAAYSALQGRGDWLTTPLRNDSRRQAYTRNLARHIDMAARDPQLLDALGICVRA